MRAFLSKVKQRSWLIIAAAGVAILLLVLLLGGARGRNAAAFQTEPLSRGSLTATVGATGTVRARHSAVLSWKTSGTVEAVSVTVGDVVEEGETLASLAPASVPQNVILAQAELAEAERALEDLLGSDRARAEALIALGDAEDAYERAYNYRIELNSQGWFKRVVIRTIDHTQVPEIRWYRGYPDGGTIAAAEEDLALKKAVLEDAQRENARLENGPNPLDVAAAEARVAGARSTADMARLVAPFNGTITQSLASPGDQVSPSQAALRLDDLSQLLIDVQVSEIDINSVEVNQDVGLTFDAILGREYKGRVIDVGLAGDTVEGVVSFVATIELLDPDQLVKPGMTAAVNIVVTQLDDVLLVPNRAVRVIDGKRSVYVLQDGMPVAVTVQLGASSDERSVLVGGDLKEGDLVVLNPPSRMFGPFGE